MGAVGEEEKYWTRTPRKDESETFLRHVMACVWYKVNIVSFHVNQS